MVNKSIFSSQNYLISKCSIWQGHVGLYLWLWKQSQEKVSSNRGCLWSCCCKLVTGNFHKGPILVSLKLNEIKILCLLLQWSGSSLVFNQRSIDLGFFIKSLWFFIFPALENLAAASVQNNLPLILQLLSYLRLQVSSANWKGEGKVQTNLI